MTRTPEQEAAVPMALYTATRNAEMANRGLDIARVILSEAVRTATEVDEVRDAMRDAGSVLP